MVLTKIMQKKRVRMDHCYLPGFGKNFFVICYLDFSLMLLWYIAFEFVLALAAPAVIVVLKFASQIEFLGVVTFDPLPPTFLLSDLALLARRLPWHFGRTSSSCG